VPEGRRRSRVGRSLRRLGCVLGCVLVLVAMLGTVVFPFQHMRRSSFRLLSDIELETLGGTLIVSGQSRADSTYRRWPLPAIYVVRDRNFHYFSVYLRFSQDSMQTGSRARARVISAALRHDAGEQALVMVSYDSHEAEGDGGRRVVASPAAGWQPFAPSAFLDPSVGFTSSLVYVPPSVESVRLSVQVALDFGTGEETRALTFRFRRQTYSEAGFGVVD